VFRVMNVNGELFGRIATNQPVECVALRSDAVSTLLLRGSVVSQINPLTFSHLCLDFHNCVYTG